MRSARARGFLAIALSALLHSALLYRLPAPGSDVPRGPNDGARPVTLAFARAAPAPQERQAREASRPAPERPRTTPREQPAEVGEAAPKETRETAPREPEPGNTADDRPTEIASAEPADQESGAASADGGDSARARTATAGGDGEPVVIHEPRFRRPPDPPPYPRAARRRGQEGVVLVRARVDESGDVEQIRIMRSSGVAVLDEAAQQAVRGWEFEPYRRNGRTMTAWVELPVVFDLR